MFRVVGCLVLAVVSAAVLSACTSAADIPDSGPLAVHPRPEAGMDALLEGVLRADDGCVRVEHEGGTAVPTFPAGDASWSGDTLTWRGDEYTDGDAIALGGGFMGTASAPSSDGYMPEACVGLEVFVVSPY
ncbi:hypothetical protein MK786_08700 [Microbacterium sp. CFH 31415]|uniref:hypothetical protein n=1 Tax=Microbacterium sp. CFH 31415 TaxID=2921732 RepID=UPI001F13DDBB|nr:hypothetical protein [Microbacterium sp. CFH 31415]MCH6230814.1 hypothetical protein [Microbacterium sp. CFH 31415]